MNTIVYAGYDCDEKFEQNKYVKICCAEKGGKVDVFSGANANTDGNLCVVLERAALPGGIALTLPEPESAFVRDIAIQAAHYFAFNSPKKELVLGALGELLCALINLAGCGGKKFSPVVNAVRESADKNVTDAAYSLEDFLKKLPLNYDYVRKLYKKETGETPHAYLLKKRMELAANLLSGTFQNKYSNYTVAQVAEACGFSDPLYFSRVFKKFYGVAPSSYC